MRYVEKSPNTWKLNNTLLKKTKVKEITGEIKNFELHDNENNTSKYMKYS